MIKFDIITIFPDIFTSYFSESIIKRAQQKKLIKINVRNLRDFTTDRHKTVDDKPYGGGPGMIIKLEPVYKAVSSLIKIKNTNKKQKIILFSPGGKKFDQKMAKGFSKLDRLILICGHYEGVDERVTKYIADEEISIGDYILTGGEIPAMIVVDAVSRLIPGVLGKEESIEEKRGSYPVYTRPEVFNPAQILQSKTTAGKPKKGVEWRAPKVLLSGDHKKIEEWRRGHSK